MAFNSKFSIAIKLFKYFCCSTTANHENQNSSIYIIQYTYIENNEIHQFLRFLYLHKLYFFLDIFALYSTIDHFFMTTIFSLLHLQHYSYGLQWSIGHTTFRTFICTYVFMYNVYNTYVLQPVY